MKLINLIGHVKKKLGGKRKDLAKVGDMSLAQLNNLVSQDREVLELADGNYILVSKQTKIFKIKCLRLSENE